jgi:hypothetical protein
MTTGETNVIADLLDRVQNWPAPMRLALARGILETLETAVPDQMPRQLPLGPSAAEVAARFATDHLTPTDAEVQQILEEELARKYGR